MSAIEAKARKRIQGEKHHTARVGWLRAAVLGSNDAIVSTSSLMLGVAAASATREAIFIAGISGLVAGAMSMAVGEFVSVSSQKDAEIADIKIESRELETQPAAELQELTDIYIKRGLDCGLAKQVAEALSQKDRLGSHLRDELGIDSRTLAHPFQAAWISAVSFATFALIPIIGLLIAHEGQGIPVIAVLSSVSLAALGAFGAHLGGAPLFRAAFRVTLGGGLAMGITAIIGRLVGASVGN